MRKLREILRLKLDLGASVREIAQSCNLARSTASDYVGRIAAAQLSWPLPPELDDDEALERLLFPHEGHPKARRPEPDWAEVHWELRRKHVEILSNSVDGDVIRRRALPCSRSELRLGT
ncbi:MAG: hypothetical protein FJ108_13945 [Deltaproteobacteria bacterium]|nr:hypothetical protein [Deltaproteobacteria bacterium]